MVSTCPAITRSVDQDDRRSSQQEIGYQQGKARQFPCSHDIKRPFRQAIMEPAHQGCMISCLASPSRPRQIHHIHSPHKRSPLTATVIKNRVEPCLAPFNAVPCTGSPLSRSTPHACQRSSQRSPVGPRHARRGGIHEGRPWQPCALSGSHSAEPVGICMPTGSEPKSEACRLLTGQPAASNRRSPSGAKKTRPSGG